jgi:hypothetical protein
MGPQLEILSGMIGEMTVTALARRNVRDGSWLCENAKALYRNRRSHLSKTVSGIQFENTFDLEIELKNVILVTFRFFAFLHSQGHSRPGRASSKSGHVRCSAEAEVDLEH